MQRNVVPITLAISATITSVAQGNGGVLCGLYVPKALTGTTLKVLAYNKNGEYQGIVSDGAGSDVSITVESATDQFIRFDTTLYAGIEAVAFVTGSSQSSAIATLRPVFAV